MKRIYLLSVCFLFLSFVNAQTSSTKKNTQKPNSTKQYPVKKVCPECITTSEAAKRIGENVKVIGVVKKVKAVDWEAGKPWFIDLDKKFPNIVFNAVIFEGEQDKFSFDKVQSYLGKKVIVSGNVHIHHYPGNKNYPPSDYPQITITETSQLKVLK
jgi:hypothetical protein